MIIQNDPGVNGNSLPFSSTLPSDRISTSATTQTWTIYNSWIDGATVGVPNIANVIQAVVNKLFWQSGNALTLLFYPSSTSTCPTCGRVAENYYYDVMLNISWCPKTSKRSFLNSTSNEESSELSETEESEVLFGDSTEEEINLRRNLEDTDDKKHENTNSENSENSNKNNNYNNKNSENSENSDKKYSSNKQTNTQPPHANEILHNHQPHEDRKKYHPYEFVDPLIEEKVHAVLTNFPHLTCGQQLTQLAIEECFLYDEVRYVTDAWLKAMHMSHMKEHFIPICRLPGVVKTVDEEDEKDEVQNTKNGDVYGDEDDEDQDVDYSGDGQVKEDVYSEVDEYGDENDKKKTTTSKSKNN